MVVKHTATATSTSTSTLSSILSSILSSRASAPAPASTSASDYSMVQASDVKDHRRPALQGPGVANVPEMIREMIQCPRGLTCGGSVVVGGCTTTVCTTFAAAGCFAECLLAQ